MATHLTQAIDQRRLYNDLSWVWPIISTTDEYIEESELFAATIKQHARIPVKEILHLGCGGGFNDYTLKKHFQVTSVDLSQSMLANAQKLNPEITYIQGDMRSTRLNKTFDAVTILDSIAYMRSPGDIRQTYQTVYHHLKPGGIFLTIIEYSPHHFPQNHTSVETKQKDNTEVVFIENNYDPDPSDTTFEATFVFLVHQNQKQEVYTDRHILGLFPLETWVNLLKETPFHVQQLEFKHSTFTEPESLPLLIAIKE